MDSLFLNSSSIWECRSLNCKAQGLFQEYGFYPLGGAYIDTAKGLGYRVHLPCSGIFLFSLFSNNMCINNSETIYISFEKVKILICNSILELIFQFHKKDNTLSNNVSVNTNFVTLLYFRRNKTLIKELSTPPEGSSDLSFPTKYSQTFLTQCFACLWKQNMSYWRNPPYTAVKYFYTTVIALLFGTMFWGVGRKR